MKYLLSIMLLIIALTAHADERVQSPIYNYDTAQQAVSSLKRYIKQAKLIIKRYELVLNDYEKTLIRLHGLHGMCKTYGKSFTNAQKYAGCGNRNVSNLSNKLRRVALRLDKLEERIIGVKYHIKNASNILIGINEKSQINTKADSIIEELDRMERRNKALDQEAGLS